MSNRHRDRGLPHRSRQPNQKRLRPRQRRRSSAESEAAVTLNENGKYCPGHVDLTITVKTTGLKEKHNLFALDGTGNQAVGNWQGWTEEKQTAAQTLAAQDWQEMYGLVSSEFALGNPLTPAEIASYLDLLPEDLSPERRAVITCALNSVGKIPYYYGGKPSTAGLSGNHFASVTSPDYKGRILSGLDCSGWVNWVYWTALGNRMGAACSLRDCADRTGDQQRRASAGRLACPAWR